MENNRYTREQLLEIIVRQQESLDEKNELLLGQQELIWKLIGIGENMDADLQVYKALEDLFNYE